MIAYFIAIGRHAASASVPVAVVTPRIRAPARIPTRMPAVRIPRSTPPEPDARRGIDPDARSGSAPPIGSAPIRESIRRRQSKSDAERQDERGEKDFHAGLNGRPLWGIPSRSKKTAEAASHSRALVAAAQ
jgi:hypothetical protein